MIKQIKRMKSIPLTKDPKVQRKERAVLIYPKTRQASLTIAWCVQNRVSFRACASPASHLLPGAVTALTLVDTRFRVISSLEKIIVGVYDDGDLSSSMMEIDHLGWTITATEYEWDTDTQTPRRA